MLNNVTHTALYLVTKYNGLSMETHKAISITLLGP